MKQSPPVFCRRKTKKKNSQLLFVIREYAHGLDGKAPKNGEDISVEMKMSVEKAKKRALELMYKGYH